MMDTRLKGAIKELTSDEFSQERGLVSQKAIDAIAEWCSLRTTEAVVGFSGRNGNYKTREHIELTPTAAFEKLKLLLEANAKFEVQALSNKVDGTHRVYFTTRIVDEDGRHWDQTITFTERDSKQ